MYGRNRKRGGNRGSNSAKGRPVYGRGGVIFLGPDLCGVLYFSILPSAVMLYRSFRDGSDRRWVGLANYREVLGNAAFRLALYNTVRFIAVCIPLLLAASLSAAVILQGTNRKISRFCRLQKSALLMPMALPAASVVLVWRILFHPRGLVNGFLQNMRGVLPGMGQIDWMNSEAAFVVLILCYLWKNLGYDMILWMAGLAQISPELYDAAQVDGAGAWQRFRHITLPNLRKSVFLILVLSLVNVFQVFREAYLVAGDYPHPSMYLLQHLYNNWFRNLSFERIAAAAVMNAAVIALLLLLLQRTGSD